MKVNVIRVGNSRGIRIPKPLLEACKIGDQVELVVKGGSIVVSPTGKPREGWELAFSAAERVDDQPLLPDAPTAWDKSEWRW